jgi:hypothetical protein
MSDENIHQHEYSKVVVSSTTYRGKDHYGRDTCAKFDKWEMKCQCGAVRSTGEDKVIC